MRTTKETVDVPTMQNISSGKSLAESVSTIGQALVLKRPIFDAQSVDETLVPRRPGNQRDVGLGRSEHCPLLRSRIKRTNPHVDPWIEHKP
jgi:hypothetical protein